MEEQLQGLLDRIRAEGVERAEAEAAAIVREAHEKAQATVGAARAEADEIRARAEAHAKVVEARSETALEQTGRDFLLSLQKSIDTVLRESLTRRVSEALDPEVLAQMLVRLADAYARKDMNESRVDVLLSPEDRELVTSIVLADYRDLVNQGLTLRADGGIGKGFKVSFVDENVYHDFTMTALVETLAPLLKSPLREIMERIPEEQA